MELNNEQLKFINSNEQKILLLSGAGGGKTRCIVERTKRLINTGADPSKIVLLTFTNLATEELRQRLEGYPVLIFTIHSYCNYLLRCGGYDTFDFLNEDNFDELFNEIKRHPECAQQVEHLLLDEGHDTDLNQFTFLFEIVKPKNWVICADFKQTIYEWRNACPQYIIDLSKNPTVSVYTLTYNYRCKKKILDFAKRIILRLGYEYEDSSRAVKAGGEVYETDFSNSLLLSIFKKTTSYNDWFVLTRSNKQIEEIGSLFKKNKIPYTTFKQGNMSLSQLQEELNKNQVLLLTVHSAKGLERPNVIVIGAKWWKDEDIRINYVAATRAIDKLIWLKEPKKRKQKMYNWE